MSEAIYDVRGMTCASCAKRVERAIERVQGVSEASVDLVRERARVVGTPRDAELAEAVRKAGYELQRREVGAPATKPTRELRAPIAIFLALTALAIDVFTQAPPWITLAISALVTFGLGGPLFVRAWRLALARDVAMETLVVLGSTAALALGTMSLFVPSHHGHGHSDASTAALVIAIVLGGKSAESRAKKRATAELDRLAGSDAAPVRVTRHGATAEIAIGELRADDVVRVAPFAIVPADGTLESEHAYVDEAALTGESRASAKALGEIVLGGTLNGPAPLSIRVSAVGAASFRGRLEAETSAALSRPPREAMLADRASRLVVPLALAASVSAFFVHLAMGASALEATRPAIDVLVVTCPCALGLATPAALVAALGRAAREGIVVRDATRFLDLARVTRLFFDKTGTLTEGRARVQEIVMLGDVPERRAWELTASIEADSEHPVGSALFLSAMERGIAALPATDARVVPGRGIEANVDGQRVRVEAASAEIAAARAAALRAEGCTLVVTSVDDVPVALFAIRDRLRPRVAQIIARLRKRGIALEMLSGDHADTARSVGLEVGLDASAVHGGMRPEDKARVVTDARRADVVAMIGDGVNDAPALAASDVGIAIGGGAGAAVRSAALTLRDGDLARVETATSLADATSRTIRGNLVWAFAYNVVAVPLAAAGAIDWIGGAPVAAAAMAGSSIAVLLWSLRLSRVRLTQ